MAENYLHNISSSNIKLDPKIRQQIRALQRKNDILTTEINELKSYKLKSNTSIASVNKYEIDASANVNLVSGYVKTNVETASIVNAIYPDTKLVGFTYDTAINRSVVYSDNAHTHYYNKFKIADPHAGTDVTVDLTGITSFDDVVTALNTANATVTIFTNGNLTPATVSGTVKGISGIAISDYIKITQVTDETNAATAVNWTLTQFLNKLNFQSSNYVLLADGTKIGLEPDNTFKLPNNEYAKFKATGTGIFNITSKKTLDAITKLVTKYNNLFEHLGNIVDEIPSSSSISSNIKALGYKSITIQDYYGTSGTAMLSDFGIRINNDGTVEVIDDNKLETAASADYTKAANFFNRLSNEMSTNYLSLVERVNEEISSLQKQQDETNSKVDKIVQKAEEKQLKFEQMQQKLKEMMEDFKVKLEQMQELFS